MSEETAAPAEEVSEARQNWLKSVQENNANYSKMIQTYGHVHAQIYSLKQALEEMESQISAFQKKAKQLTENEPKK